MATNSRTNDTLLVPEDATADARWAFHPVNWTAVWVGSLAAIAAVLLFGLIGVAVGAHLVVPGERVIDLKKIAMGTLAYSIFTAFLAFVLCGWVAATVAGIRRAEPAIFHGVVAWLVALPLVVILAGLGAGSYLGAWHGGVAGTPNWAAPASVPFDRPDLILSSATEAERTQYATALAEYHERVRLWRDQTPQATRNVALGALTALLLGLMGSVVGGWMASGEPMTFTAPRPTALSVPQTQRVLTS